MVDLTKKIITRGAVVALAISAGTSTTANAAVTRVSGADRYATSTQVLDSWPTTPTTAILAAGVGHDVDALTVAPLAKQKNAPVILVDTTATTAAIVSQFDKFDTVYIANGTGVISTNVEAALTAAGKTVVRLGGATRYETALNIAKAFGNANSIVIANGDDAHLVDSLSIASIAASKGMPIFLSSANLLEPDEATYAKGLSATNTYVLGGPTLVSDAAVKDLGTVTRLAGAGRYETNAAIVTNFKNDTAVDLSNIYIASGEDANLIDSLVAAPLAGLKKAPIIFAHNNINPYVNTLLTGIVNAKTSITVVGGIGAVNDAAFSAIQNIQVPGSGNAGTVTVSSVSAINATSFKVVFTKAPADTSKVTFSVLRGTVPLTETTTWNASNTEAIVSNSSNLPAGDYTIDVKNDATDLGTSTVTVAQEAVAKINITSTKLGVTNANTGNGTGYATYSVLDQYGNDITTSSLANSLTFESGAGTVTGKNGILTLTPTMNLLQLSTVVITGYDPTSGVSTSATLTTSSQVGTLSDINLTSLTNVDKKVLTAGDTSSLFYVTYSATDISGNLTKDFNVVKNGLILNSSNQLTTSSPYVTATVVPDPSDSTKAAIQVQVANNTSISMDMPVTITAMTYTGKTSTLNVTLKKALAVDTFTLMAPAYDIAAGDSKEIPFTAVDQNGNPLTKASDLTGVTFSGNIATSTNVDGTLKLTFTPGTATGSQIITAMTPTGKYNSLTINVQKTAVADSLALDTSVLNNLMQATQNTGTVTSPSYTTTVGAVVQHADFGWDKGGLTVKDQYGRVMDMTTAGASVYSVVASSNDETVVSTAGDTATTGQHEISLTALKPGSATVTFKLFSSATTNPDGTARDNTVPIDTKSETFTVIQNSDIKGYTIDTVPKPIYAISANGVPVTPIQSDFTANPKVYGKTSTGGKVLLAGTPIIGATVDSSDFSIYGALAPATPVTPATPVPADAVEVSAKTLADTTKTGSSTTLAVTILGADGAIYSVTTPITSSTVAPKAASIDVYVATQVPGISRSGDIITLTTATGGTYANMLGSSLAKYNANGAAGKQNVYIAATDQYGTTGFPLSQFVVVSKTAGSPFDVGTNGTITGTARLNDVVTISGITNNGLVKTIELDFK